MEGVRDTPALRFFFLFKEKKKFYIPEHLYVWWCDHINFYLFCTFVVFSYL